jgi:carotenoid cleavage dioxygenase-like enzyme
MCYVSLPAICAFFVTLFDVSDEQYVSVISVSNTLFSVEFPVINPNKLSKKYEYAYCATSASATGMTPLQGLAKFNVNTGELMEKWLPEPSQYLTEVVFCPKANAKREDDGYLITYLLDPNKRSNKVVVFNAENPGKGPIAQSDLRGWNVNHSLHGTFIPGFTPDLTVDIKATFL